MLRRSVPTLAMVLALLGTLIVQLGGGIACSDGVMPCATTRAPVAQAETKHDSCCGSEECCCAAESAAPAEEDAEAPDPCCAKPDAGVPTDGCGRCGCAARRAPPTPVPDRPVRTVEFKSIPAILHRAPERVRVSIASPVRVTPAARIPVDRGKHRALLSVWVI